jgi:hypothetical protein
MTKNPQRARSDRYAAASIAQYLHELSGRHADEREHAAHVQPGGAFRRAVAPAKAGSRSAGGVALAGH